MSCGNQSGAGSAAPTDFSMNLLPPCRPSILPASGRLKPAFIYVHNMLLAVIFNQLTVLAQILSSIEMVSFLIL